MKKKTSRYWWSFSRLVFHGLPPLEAPVNFRKRKKGLFPQISSNLVNQLRQPLPCLPFSEETPKSDCLEFWCHWGKGGKLAEKWETCLFLPIFGPILGGKTYQKRGKCGLALMWLALGDPQRTERNGSEAHTRSPQIGRTLQQSWMQNRPIVIHPCNFDLPFVRIHSGNNSKIIFLCICTFYEIEIISTIIFICYAAPPQNCKEQLCLYLLRKIKSKIIVVCICICYEMHK